MKIASGMETIFYYFQYYYYTNLTLYSTTWICFILSFRNRNKIPDFPYFYIYPLISLTQQTISILSPLAQGPDAFLFLQINNIVINSFIGFETIFILLFFYKYFRKNKRITLVLFSLTLVFIAAFLFSGIKYSYSYNNKYVYLLGSLTLIVPSFLYFYFIFIEPAKINLFSYPVFWISSSTLLTFGCLIPVTIVLDEISNDPNHPFDPSIYSIIYILYTLFFVLISKAFACPKIDKP